MTVVQAACGAILILGVRDDSKERRQAMLQDHGILCLQDLCRRLSA